MTSWAIPPPRTESCGPLRWVRLPYCAGEPAEPMARAWLAQEWQADPASLRLLRNPHGRPYLDQRQHAGWDIGWSHSGNGLLIAVGREVRVGVDLERPRARPRALELARRFFTPQETAWLTMLPPSAAEAMFVRVWCAKEALLKAHGRGIAFGLHRLRFAWDNATDRLFLCECDPALGSAQAWRLHETTPQPGERAVLAWQAHALGADSLDNPAL